MEKKRLTLAATALLATLATQAEDYGCLALRQTGGTVTTLTANGLHITFADGNLVATQGGQTTTLPLADLTAMYFTTDDATGISAPSTAKGTLTVDGGTVKVTAAQGTRLTLHTLGGTALASLTATGGEQTLGANLQEGVYIVGINGHASKIIVK